MLIAVKGQGAYQRSLADPTETKISVSGQAEGDKAVLTESPNSSHSSPHLTSIREDLGTTADPLLIDSQCKYAVVARGDSDVYLRYSGLTYKECIWDHAPGVIIVEEAGGSVEDMSGKPLDFSLGRKLTGNVGLVVTNSKLRDTVFKSIEKIDPIGLDGAKDD